MGIKTHKRIDSTVASRSDLPRLPSLTSPRPMGVVSLQITAIRPLGQSAGPGYPSVFPHDMAEEVKRMQGKTQIVTMMNERALLSWYVPSPT